MACCGADIGVRVTCQVICLDVKGTTSSGKRVGFAVAQFRESGYQSCLWSCCHSDGAIGTANCARGYKVVAQ